MSLFTVLPARFLPKNEQRFWATISSSVEKPFAVELDQAEEVKVLAKLPDRFKIDTTLSSYNPDWATLSRRTASVNA